MSVTPPLLVWIPGPVRSVQSGGHGHWTARAGVVKAQRTKAHLLVSAACAKAGWLVGSDVPKIVTFAASVHNLMDDENLAYALKPTRDGLRDAGIIHDDSPRSGHVFHYVQEIDRKRPGVMVRVEPAG